jgi:hypothetical protein
MTRLLLGLFGLLLLIVVLVLVPARCREAWEDRAKSAR